MSAGHFSSAPASYALRLTHGGGGGRISTSAHVSVWNSEKAKIFTPVALCLTITHHSPSFLRIENFKITIKMCNGYT